MEFDLVSDISTLTTIPDKTLRKLCDRGIDCICHSVLDVEASGESETLINVGIGEIKIIHINDELHYRFVPSAKLEKALINAITTGEDNLVRDIEESLVTRILNTYKDLI